ncbi:hypothetical protein N431DRAFT_446970 [Stipitochalara longipes BDJ]|nr:hypothetical protein N431DRAFT_446970 [Stipitochalara longipes BDJ]
MPAPIVYINGWPDVGKHTIAKALEKKLNGKGRVRMLSQERLDAVAAGKGMLLDTKLLHGIRSKGESLRFEGTELLELEVSDLAPEELARRIVEHIAAVEEAGKIGHDDIT